MSEFEIRFYYLGVYVVTEVVRARDYGHACALAAYVARTAVRLALGPVDGP